jgi:hypothetical protein
MTSLLLIPVARKKLVAFWFKDKELALAFSLTLSVSRLGSMLNFLLTETFTDTFGLKSTLWGSEFCHSNTALFYVAYHSIMYWLESPRTFIQFDIRLIHTYTLVHKLTSHNLPCFFKVSSSLEPGLLQQSFYQYLIKLGLNSLDNLIPSKNNQKEW